MDSKLIGPFGCPIATMAFFVLTFLYTLLVPMRNATYDVLFLVIVGTITPSFIVMLVRRELRRRKVSRDLNRVLRKLTDAEIVERNRVSRELHDGVCQMLLATKYWLTMAQNQNGLSNEDFAYYCRRCLRQLEGAIDEIRRVSRNLKPAVLSNFEFTEAIRELVCDFSERTQIHAVIHGADSRMNRRVPSSSQVALIRIIQEALANIERHAAASQVVVNIRENPDSLWLRIADNGCGFELPANAQLARGSGLRNMRERIAEVGGTLTVRPTHEGTNIVALIPLPVERQPFESEIRVTR